MSPSGIYIIGLFRHHYRILRISCSNRFKYFFLILPIHHPVQRSTIFWHSSAPFLNSGLESGRSDFSTYIAIFSMLFNLLAPRFLCLLNGPIRSFIGLKCYNLCKAECHARDLLCKTLNGRSAMHREWVINASYGSYQQHHYYSQHSAESLTTKCNLRKYISQVFFRSPPSPLL